MVNLNNEVCDETSHTGTLNHLSLIPGHYLRLGFTEKQTNKQTKKHTKTKKRLLFLKFFLVPRRKKIRSSYITIAHLPSPLFVPLCPVDHQFPGKRTRSEQTSKEKNQQLAFQQTSSFASEVMTKALVVDLLLSASHN